jgi:hypothetical protein
MTELATAINGRSSTPPGQYLPPREFQVSGSMLEVAAHDMVDIIAEISLKLQSNL